MPFFTKVISTTGVVKDMDDAERVSLIGARACGVSFTECDIEILVGSPRADLELVVTGGVEELDRFVAVPVIGTRVPMRGDDEGEAPLRVLVANAVL